MRSQKQIQEICRAAQMPIPVRTRETRREMEVPHGPGVYIAWMQKRCVYVGKSCSLRSRILTHTVVSDDHGISVIQFSFSKIHFAELFYIWLLEPTLNNEGKLSKHKNAMSLAFARGG